jgi:signal transduction histidine kinase
MCALLHDYAEDNPSPPEDNPAPSPAALLQDAAGLARRLLRARRASLLLPADGDALLRVAAADGLPAAVGSGTVIHLEDSIASLVAHQRRPLLGNDPHPLRPDAGYRTGTYISVPVPLEDQGAGVLSVADPLAGRSFGKDDLAVLQDLAGFVSLAAGRASAQRELILAREDERLRVARELHDEAGQALAVATLRLDLEARRVLQENDPARHIVEIARAALLESAQTVHEIAHTLRPRLLEDLGLAAALRNLAARAEKGGLRVTLTITGDTADLDEGRELAIFRVAQEALTNVYKHARARRVAVRLTIERSRIALLIEDDGIGFANAPARADGRGLGVRGMRERVRVFGGTLAIGSGARGGTRLLAVLPLSAG